MQENFLHFLSDTPCLLSINGKNVGLIDNITKLEIDVLTKKDSIYTSFNPISEKNNSIPFTFKLITNPKVLCDNNYIKVVPFPNNHYDIIMKPFYYYEISNPNILLNTMIGKFFVSIITDNSTKITIYDGNNIVFNLTTLKLKSARSEIKKDLLIIEGIVDNDTYYLLVIDTKTFDILHNDISNSIENSLENISSYKKLNDISHHAEIVKISISEKKLEKYHVYEDNSPHSPLNHLLIPMAFLESVKICDENLARQYLHSFHSSTPIKKFNDFFGNIEEIYVNRHDVIYDKINYTLFTNNQFKNYNFIMEDNKIKDIEELY